MQLSSQTTKLPGILLPLLLPLLFFVTPMSSSAKSIVLPVVLVMIILSTDFRQHLITLCSNAWCRSLLLLFLIACLACFWSPADLTERGLVLEKWSKLLYLPILVVGFQEEKTRQRALHAFLFAMLITCLLSIYMKYTGFFQGGKVSADSVFRNHIMTGMMMSFATYLAAIFFMQTQSPRRFYYLLPILLFTYQIFFINRSRTGYEAYLLLTLLFIVNMLTKRQRAIAILCLCTGLVGSYFLSEPLRDSVHYTIENIHSYQTNKDTSLGYRLQFHQYAKHLFLQHPFTGVGTGGFTYSFKKDDPVPAWTHLPTHSGRLLEPHSQYWFVAAELGIVGLIVLALFYVSLFLLSWRLSAFRAMALGLLCMFALGNLTDSLLFYSGSGYFFILFLALCLSEKQNQRTADHSNLRSQQPGDEECYVSSTT